MEKICKVCGEKYYAKELCRSCYYKEYDRQWRENNKEKDRETHRQWRGKNLEKYKEYDRQWRENNKEKDRETHRQWRGKNLERCQKINKLWRENNKEKDRETHRQWREKNLDKIKEYNKQWREKNKEYLRLHQLYREHNDIEFKLKMQISNDIRQRIKNQHSIKSKKTIELLGCSIQQCREHLEKQFKSGMTWENYGKLWHIDHIIPCVHFDFKDKEQQKLCFHYINLQPLWAKENLSKGCKILDEI